MSEELPRIAGYAVLTDKAQCPMGLVNGNSQWLAPHVHDVPILYASRIVALWERRLKGEEVARGFLDITSYSTRVRGVE